MICGTLKIYDFLGDNIFLDLESKSKEGIIKEMLNLLEKRVKLKNKDDIFNQIMRRESISSTGIGFGVALPHIRTGDVSKPIIAAGISRIGVDFNAWDNTPVKIIFLLITPQDDCDSTIRFLSELSHILRFEKNREQLLAAWRPREFSQALRKIEEKAI